MKYLQEDKRATKKEKRRLKQSKNESLLSKPVDGSKLDTSKPNRRKIRSFA